MNDSTKNESPFTQEVVLQKPYLGQPRLHIPYDDKHHFDLYPADRADETGLMPCVILVCGFNDAGFQSLFGKSWKSTPPVTSWARLLAASGFCAVALQVTDPAADTCRLIEHLSQSATDYQLDSTRFALWSCSGNVPAALAVLDRSPDLAAALLMYGFMLEPTDDPYVSDAAEQFRFSHPRLSEHFLDCKADVLVVQAGQDEFHGVNASIDYFVQQASGRALSAQVLRYEEGVHAFDLLDDSEESKAILQQCLGFLSQVLKPVHR